MKSKTLQEQYNLIKEGKGHADSFMKYAKQQFPQYIRNAAGLEETINSLKHNHIISENLWGITTGKPSQPDWFEKFNTSLSEGNRMVSDKDMVTWEGMPHMIMRVVPDGEDFSNPRVYIRPDMYNKYAKEFWVPYQDLTLEDQDKVDQYVKDTSRLNESKIVEKKPTKEVVGMETTGYDYKDKENVDNTYGEEFLRGYYVEMKDPKNSEKTVEELKEIVSKNLQKDPLHYVKDGQFGIKGLGYTEDHPGLGTPKEPQGKYKSSGYGDIKESKRAKALVEYVKRITKNL